MTTQDSVLTAPRAAGGVAWKAADLEDQSRWIIHLTDAQIQCITDALEHAKSAGATLATLTRDMFPLEEHFSELIDDVSDRLENGLGIVVLRGLPALQYSKEDLRMIYWGIGLYFGTGVSQSSQGDLLGDVMNFGSDVNRSTGRGYMSKQHLGFHTDTGDVVALTVLRAAKSGGLSLIVSQLAIRDEIAETWPDMLKVLYEPFYWSWKGQEAPGEKPYYSQPIYTDKNGKFSCRYIKTHITAAYEENPELPPLTLMQKAAMSLIDLLAISPKFHLSMMFEPGAIQLLNNHITMHSRTAFEDFDEPERKRHLLRMWLAMPNTRDLHPGMAPIYQDQSGGAVRGGFPSRTGQHSFSTVQAKD